MSDLQLALLVVGVLMVVAVLVYNKWQEGRYRRRSEAGLRPSQADVLLHSTATAGVTSGRVEPTFSDDEPRAAIASGSADDRMPGAQISGVLCEELDFIVGLNCENATPGSRLVEALLEPLSSARKPVRLEGFAHSSWENLERDRDYAQMRAGMQLVDRRGRASPEELEAFEATLQHAAAKLGASIIPGSAGQGIITASKLDLLCEQVDIQIVVHVISREGAFPGTKIRSVAEAAGLVIEDDGRFRKRDAAGLEIFSLGNEEPAPFSVQGMKTLSTAALSLELDVPRADVEALNQLRMFAQQIAAGLGGVLVDDNRAPFSDAAFEAIAQQLRPVYETMRDHGIPAGSPLALRLFA